MPFLLGVAAVLIFGAKFPRAAGVAAWFITLFITAPIILVGVGSVALALSTGFDWGLSAAACYWGLGGAAALGISYLVLGD